MITAYDSIDISQIPPNAEAVMGYVGGKWPTYAELVKRFPSAKHLSIAVNAEENADCLDVEEGDATPADAPQWFRAQKTLRKERVYFYCSISVVPELEANLKAAGIQRHEYLIWSAHYTGTPHIEPGTNATQYSDKALGRNLDVSLCEDAFFGTPVNTWQPNDEINWCREWDRIKGRKTLPAHLRRLYLRGRMLARRRLITKLASQQKNGWSLENRLYRYKQLEQRSG